MTPSTVTLRSPAGSTLKYGIALAVIVVLVFCIYLALLIKGLPTDANDWAS